MHSDDSLNIRIIELKPSIAIVPLCSFDDMESERITEVKNLSLPTTQCLFQKKSIRHICSARIVAKIRTISIYDTWMECIVCDLTEKVLKISFIRLIIHNHRARTPYVFGMLLKEINLLREFFWMPDIIVVLDGYVFAFCSFEKIIQSCVRTDVFLALKKKNSRIIKRTDIFFRIIG